MKTKNFFLSLLLATVMCVPFNANAQVTIGSAEPPQATLDIRGAEGETGQAFRLIDGNQAPGRVLTAGENGVGTWRMPAGGTKNLFRHNQRPAGFYSFIARANPNAAPGTITTRVNDAVVLYHYSFELEPGFWRIDFNIPIMVAPDDRDAFSVNSGIEVMVILTTNSEGGIDVPIVNIDHTFITITYAATVRARLIGYMLVDLRAMPTQTYYLAVGRPAIWNIYRNVELRILSTGMTRRGWATYLPAF